MTRRLALKVRLSPATLRFFALLAVLVGAGPADAAQAGEFKQDMAALTARVNETVSSIVAGPLLQTARATYLEDYGVVVTIEAALEQPRNPFTTRRPAVDARRSTEERREALRRAIVELLRDELARLDSVRAGEQVAIVVHLFNTNPADLPDLPVQLVIAGRKNDAVEFRAGVITEAAFAERITVREY